MAAKWIAVHGNAGVSDSTSPVSIAYTEKGAIVTPITKQKTSEIGVIHFPLPTPPNGSAHARNLNVELETTMADVTNVDINYGASLVYTAGAKAENDLKSLDVSTISATSAKDDGIGWGICVTLEITFKADERQNQAVSFSTVGMSFSKPNPDA